MKESVKVAVNDGVGVGVWVGVGDLVGVAVKVFVLVNDQVPLPTLVKEDGTVVSVASCRTPLNVLFKPRVPTTYRDLVLPPMPDWALPSRTSPK